MTWFEGGWADSTVRSVSGATLFLLLCTACSRLFNEGSTDAWTKGELSSGALRSSRSRSMIQEWLKECHRSLRLGHCAAVSAPGVSTDLTDTSG